MNLYFSQISVALRPQQRSLLAQRTVFSAELTAGHEQRISQWGEVPPLAEELLMLDGF